MASKVLILLDHPDYKNSKANRAMIDALQGLDNVKVIDICTTPIEEKFYIDEFKKADVVIFQFPMWWFAAPAPLKEWCDKLLIGIRESGVLRGKRLMCATTTGGTEDGYQDDGRDGDFTVDKTFNNYHSLAAYCGMEYLPPFVIYGTMAPEAESNIEAGAKSYRELIEDL